MIFSKSWKICLAFLSRNSLCSAQTGLLIFASCEGCVLDTTVRSFVVLWCTSRDLLRLHLTILLDTAAAFDEPFQGPKLLH